MRIYFFCFFLIQLIPFSLHSQCDNEEIIIKDLFPSIFEHITIYEIKKVKDTLLMNDYLYMSDSIKQLYEIDTPIYILEKKRFVLVKDSLTRSYFIMINDSLRQLRSIETYQKFLDDSSNENINYPIKELCSNTKPSCRFDINKLSNVDQISFLIKSDSVSSFIQTSKQLKSTYLGMLTMSRIYLSKNKNLGVFVLHYHCIGQCGSQYLIFISKSSSKWVIDKSIKTYTY